MARHACRKRATNRNAIKTPLANSAGAVLGDGGRGVLEDARAHEWRSDPDWVQRRNDRELESGNRRHQEWGGRGLVVRAGADQRHRAFMLRRFRFGVEQLMPMWQNAQRESREQRHAYPARDSSAKERDR